MIASATSIAFVKILFLYITVKLDFGIDRKSANFDFKDPQNIRVDQIITEFSTFSFHYKLVMNFSWNPKDSHNRYDFFIAWWNRTQKTKLVSIQADKHTFPDKRRINFEDFMKSNSSGKKYLTPPPHHPPKTHTHSTIFIFVCVLF